MEASPLLSYQLNTYLLPQASVYIVSVCLAERRGRVEKNLQALFIFQESRMVVKYCEYFIISLTGL